MNSDVLIRVWKAIVITKATYGIHVVPLSNRINEKWEGLEKTIPVSTISCFNDKNKA